MRWWMRFFDAYFAPFAEHDRLERVRRSGRAATSQGRARGRDRAHSARVAPHRLAQGHVQRVQRGGTHRVAPSRARTAPAFSKHHLARHEWIAGTRYSLGDINGFNLGYALPLSQPDHCNDAKTPHIMEWLRRIYERPAATQDLGVGPHRHGTAREIPGAPPMLELYHSEPNTFFLKPLIALHEKQAAFESRWFDCRQARAIRAGILRRGRSPPAPRTRRTVAVARWHADLEFVLHARVHRRGAARRIAVARSAYDQYRARASGQFLGAHLGSLVPVLGCVKYLAPRLAAMDRATLDAKLADDRTAGAPRGLAGAARRHLHPADPRHRARAAEIPGGARRSATRAAARGSPGRATPSPTSMPSRCCACCRTWRRTWSMTAPRRASCDYLARIEARPAVRAALAMSRSGKPAAALRAWSRTIQMGTRAFPSSCFPAWSATPASGRTPRRRSRRAPPVHDRRATARWIRSAPWPRRCCAKRRRASRSPVIRWAGAWRSKYCVARRERVAAHRAARYRRAAAGRRRRRRARSRGQTRTAGHRTRRKAWPPWPRRWVQGMIWSPRLSEVVTGRQRRRHDGAQQRRDLRRADSRAAGTPGCQRPARRHPLPGAGAVRRAGQLGAGGASPRDGGARFRARSWCWCPSAATCARWNGRKPSRGAARLACAGLSTLRLASEHRIVVSRLLRDGLHHVPVLDHLALLEAEDVDHRHAAIVGLDAHV